MKLRKFKISAALFFVALMLMNPVFAMREPRATSVDSRIRVMVYHPNDVFKYIGYYGYQGNIELEQGETVDTISMGDSVAWQIIPSGNRIFLKPIDEDATTNMTLITNRRIYFFELHAKKASNINDPGLVFAVKFLYPGSSNGAMDFSSQEGPSLPDLSKREKYNFKYTISGSDVVAPVKIFDDGRFTYFQFKSQNAPIPAFFQVDSKGNESIVNYQVVGGYIVLEAVASQYTLRYGHEITCVFNEL
jgi:type IV secretion system protein VirB9